MDAEVYRGAITARVPGGWYVKESLTLVARDGQANVIASSEPLDAALDAERYAEVQGNLLRTEFPGFQEHAFYETQLLGERRGYLRHFGWTPPDSAPVTQIQLYYTEAGRGYTVTASTSSSNFAKVEVELRQILAGLTLTAGG